MTPTQHIGLTTFVEPKNYPVINQIWGIDCLMSNLGCHKIPTLEKIVARVNEIGACLLPTDTTYKTMAFRELCDIISMWNLGIHITFDIPEFARQDTIHLNNATSLKNIAQDEHNVHNSAINNLMKNISINLTTDYPCKHLLGMVESTNSMDINELQKLHKTKQKFISTLMAKLKNRKRWDDKINTAIKFIFDSTVHFNIHVTLLEILASLMLWINTHQGELRDELYNRLFDELSDMSGQCSTGHMSRLINVMQGFTENPRYILTIDVKEEINQAVRNKLTGALQDASDDIIEGIVDKTPLYLEFMDGVVQRMLPVWIDSFGKDHEEYINSIIKEYTAEEKE